MFSYAGYPDFSTCTHAFHGYLDGTLHIRRCLSIGGDKMIAILLWAYLKLTEAFSDGISFVEVEPGEEAVFSQAAHTTGERMN